jgi:hypothetical protein
MKKPEFIFHKRADKTLHKIIIPKFLIEQWGYDYVMEIYEDKIVLIPIKKD